ncbi:MAG: flippase-like domain-containing protein [Acidobacteria bacterium]|nr:flippase-like domain-containing protein [Acidobacteriota bacterium]MBI3472269.1 flippase-like domain-containing protein [Candidatus Solibacter usitatus]
MDREPQSSRRKVPAWLLPVLGYALSIASLVWVFHGFPLKEALDDFRAQDWRYVTLAVASDLAIYLCGGWRWTILVRPVARAGFWRAVQAIYIGLYANEILPLRTGEVIRCYLMAHWNSLPMSLALSSAAIERILDGIWLVIAFLVTAFFIELPKGIVEGARALAVLLLLLLGMVGFIMFRKHQAHAALSSSRWAVAWSHLVEGIHAMGNPGTLTLATLASLLYLVLQIIPVWALMKGSDMDLSIWAASAVLIIIRLGTVIPNAPGNAGIYQAMCVLGLKLFDVPKSTAISFSLTMFGVLTLPLLIGGFIAVELSGLKLHDIRHRARSSVKTAALSRPQAD